MSRLLIQTLIYLLILISNINAKENIMILKLKDGDVKIELFTDHAPEHVNRIKKLADEGLYDDVVFHRVIEDFMAQTGDVRFGNSKSQYYQATDKCKGTVALFTGCIMDHLFPHVHSATVRILNWNGYNVIIPSNQTCCGALHAHTGDNSSANKLAKKNNEILLNGMGKIILRDD